MYDKLLKCLNEKSKNDTEEVQWIFWVYERSIWKRSDDEGNFIDQNYLEPNWDSLSFLKDLADRLVEWGKIEWGNDLLGLDWNIIDIYGEAYWLLMLLIKQEDKIDFLESILK